MTGHSSSTSVYSFWSCSLNDLYREQLPFFGNLLITSSLPILCACNCHICSQRQRSRACGRETVAARLNVTGNIGKFLAYYVFLFFYFFRRQWLKCPQKLWQLISLLWLIPTVLWTNFLFPKLQFYCRNRNAATCTGMVRMLFAKVAYNTFSTLHYIWCSSEPSLSSHSQLSTIVFSEVLDAEF